MNQDGQWMKSLLREQGIVGAYFNRTSFMAMEVTDEAVFWA